MDTEKDLQDVIEELKRELEVRKNIYPQWVASRRITPKVAQHRINCIETAIANLQAQCPEQLTLL